MTVKEAFALAYETIERKLDETARKWGYTVEREDGSGWVCWRIAGLSSADFISIKEFKSSTLFEIVTDKASVIGTTYFLPTEMEAVIGQLVSQALEKAVLRLAYEELRGILLGSISIVSKDFVESELRVDMSPEAFFITFRLNKKSWSWRVTTVEGKPVIVIRRPLSENPVQLLREAVKYFGLLLL